MKAKHNPAAAGKYPLKIGSQQAQTMCGWLVELNNKQFHEFIKFKDKDTQERQWLFAVSAAICPEQVSKQRKIPRPRNV